MCKNSIRHENGSLWGPHHTPVMCSYVHETIAIAEKIKCEEGHRNQSTFNPAEKKEFLLSIKGQHKRISDGKCERKQQQWKFISLKYIHIENEESEQKMDTSMKWRHVNKVSENEIKNFITEKAWKGGRKEVYCCAWMKVNWRIFLSDKWWLMSIGCWYVRFSYY